LYVAAICVALHSAHLTPSSAIADCACRPCGAPLCQQLCRKLDCRRCCKCCVYFDHHMGRRSAAAKRTDQVFVVSDCRQVRRPHQRRCGPVAAAAAEMIALCKRSRRLPVCATMSLLLSEMTRNWPELIVCMRNMALYDVPISPSNLLNE